MSDSLLVRGLVRRLGDAGYKPLETPFRVASVDFDFTAALLGTNGRALDLVLIVDTATGEFGDRNATSVRQRIESLSRALDVTQSRYLLTIILAGATLGSLVDALSSICRVLNIEEASLEPDGRPRDDAAKEALDDHIRLLLPLDLTIDAAVPEEAPKDPLAELRLGLPSNIDPALWAAISEASSRGEDAVERALGKRLSDALTVEVDP